MGLVMKIGGQAFRCDWEPVGDGASLEGWFRCDWEPVADEGPTEMET